MSQSLQDVLDAARQLPPEERRRLAEQLLDEIHRAGGAVAAEQAAALAVVDELYGTIKGLDRDTLIWLAEDEELCGY
jgi:hypothetical protein